MPFLSKQIYSTGIHSALLNVLDIASGSGGTWKSCLCIIILLVVCHKNCELIFNS